MEYAVVCVGDRRNSDDGFSAAVRAYLERRYRFPDAVTLLQHAAFDPDTVSDLTACRHALIVTAVDGTGSAPGSAYRFALDAADRFPGFRAKDEMALADVVSIAVEAGLYQDGYCFAVQVKDWGGLGVSGWLSAAVEAAVPQVARQVVRCLAEAYGVAVVDAWAEDDPLRAGSAGAGARSFSTRYGVSDNQMLAMELADRLYAAGAEYVAREGACVSWKQEPNPALAAFGVTFAAGRALACVGADLQDYDIDALVRTAREALTS